MTEIEMINGYKNDLFRLIAKKDACSIKMCIDAKKSWDNKDTNYTISTKNVKYEKLMNFMEDFESDYFDEPKLLTIIPIGLILNCHNNCIRFCELNNNYTIQLGYNITACKCNECFGMEIHSVIKNKTTNELFDITKDFNNEEQKWFIPLKTDVNIYEFTGINGNDFNYYTTCKKCKCNITWDTPKNKTNPKDMGYAVKMCNEYEELCNIY